MMDRLPNLDIRIVLIILLIAVSTGHVGKLFADREAEGQAGLGYVLALGIDGVLVVSLYELARTEGRHRWAALGVFLAACGVSGGFNVGYYRVYHPSDPPWLSLLLGATAPGLGAALGVLKSMGDVEKAEAEALDRQVERQAQLDLEKFEIEQKEETKRLAEQEKTRRSQEKTRQTELKAEQSREKREAMAQRSQEKQRELLETLGKSLEVLRLIAENPDQSKGEWADKLEIHPRTLGYHLRKLEERGIINRNGDRVEILVDEALL